MDKRFIKFTVEKNAIKKPTIINKKGTLFAIKY